ncbi:hypothetical protein, partial [Streptomyces prunicolor]|uniref:hypothetical protein n=1 Tax=Streptomyces prunicolor TaxID=67348 RepID=UPI0033EF5EFC
MKPRIAVVTLAVCTALAPLSGCGSGTTAHESSPSIRPSREELSRRCRRTTANWPSTSLSRAPELC